MTMAWVQGNFVRFNGKLVFLEATVRRRPIAKGDLKLKLFRRREVQQLSDSEAKKRLQACMRIKQLMTVDKIERTWLNDEEIFTAQAIKTLQINGANPGVKEREVLPLGSVKVV